jgi:hypothetical protein
VKPRLLIPVSLQFTVRYILRTGLLQRIGEFVEPVLLLAWEDPDLKAELERFGEVHQLPKAAWGKQYGRVRDYLSTCHRQRFASPSFAIRERRANLDRPFAARIRRHAWLKYSDTLVRFPGKAAKLRESEAALLWTDTNARDIQRQVQALKPDAVFCLTPFLVDEELLVRVCAIQGMPVCTSILSFDNLTTRSWIPITFDLYMLWNRHNQEQLRRGYPDARGRRIEIVGAPQFDFYWDSSYIWEEREWRRKLGIAEGRPVILFGGGYYTCAPHEPQFLRQLDDAVDSGQLDRDTVILFRRHPVDPMERWEPVLRAARHVVHDEPWRLGSRVLGHTNVRREDIEKLASTLQHCSVHVNVASTMTIDGAIFDRPQIGPAYDDGPGHKYHRAALECYLQEHYLPIANSGGVSLVRSREELIQEVRSSLAEPDRARVGRQRLVRELCTYDDGKCTERVVTALARFARGEYRSGIAEGQTALAS